MTEKRLLALVGSVCLILVLAVLPFMGACAPEEVTPPPEEEVTPPPEEEVTPPPFKGVTLKFAYTMPEKVSISQGWHWWGEELEKRTDGKVKVEFYPGGTLFGIHASIDSLIGGVADIAMTAAGNFQPRFPLSNIIGLPTACFPSGAEGYTAGASAMMTLYDKFPEMAAEYKDFKLLWIHSLSSYLVVSNKEVRVPDDLKGLKVGTDGPKLDFMAACGAVPMEVASPDSYMAMDRGMVDATLRTWSQVGIYHLTEVAKYFMDYGFSPDAMPIIMNWDSWNAIPADIQKIMIDLAPGAIDVSSKAMAVSLEKGIKSVKDADLPIATLTADEMKSWEEAGKAIEDAWIADLKAKGIKNPEQVLAEWKRLAAEAWK